MSQLRHLLTRSRRRKPPIDMRRPAVLFVQYGNALARGQADRAEAAKRQLLALGWNVQPLNLVVPVTAEDLDQAS